jgi:hypothetical protein
MMNMLKIVMKTLLIVLQDYLMFVLEEQFIFVGASSLKKYIVRNLFTSPRIVHLKGTETPPNVF